MIFRSPLMSLTSLFISDIPCSRSTSLDPCVTLEVTEEEDFRMLGEPRGGVVYAAELVVEVFVVGVLACVRVVFMDTSSLNLKSLPY